MKNYSNHGEHLADDLYIGNVRLNTDGTITAHDRRAGIIQQQNPAVGYVFSVELPARGDRPAVTYQATTVAGLVAAVRAGEPA